MSLEPPPRQQLPPSALPKRLNLESKNDVNDRLKSVAKPTEAIDLLIHTRAMLATANLHLHKMASSHLVVTHAYATEDQASDLCNLKQQQQLISLSLCLVKYIG